MTEQERELDFALSEALDEIERLKQTIAEMKENVEVIDWADSVRSELE